MFNSATAFNQNIGDWDISNVTSMVNMLTECGMSTSTYKNVLSGWGNRAITTGVQYGVTLDAVPLKYYPEGGSWKYILTTFYGWHITDGGAA